ncbi:MAG: tRNA (adenine22-N1)-methyltransferase [Flavobacteriales bacterium]
MKVPGLRKLSLRLTHLYHWLCVNDEYDEIWDACCDHGQLGLHLHQALPNAKVKLLDCVPAIIEQLKFRCASYSSANLHIEMARAEGITLGAGQRPVVVLAGLGGETIMTIMDEILVRNKVTLGNNHLDFVLSTNSHAFELRHYLREQGFHLIDEAYICDKGCNHEHLHIRYGYAAGMMHSPSLTGEVLWQPFDCDKARYLAKIITHSHKALRSAPEHKNHFKLQSYMALEKALSESV